MFGGSPLIMWRDHGNMIHHVYIECWMGTKGIWSSDPGIFSLPRLILTHMVPGVPLATNADILDFAIAHYSPWWTSIDFVCIVSICNIYQYYCNINTHHLPHHYVSITNSQPQYSSIDPDSLVGGFKHSPNIWDGWLIDLYFFDDL